ncbi:uncharacterized protein LOC134707433 [Mytilus trossulus]|uniref:uncharacterized protein LOC134707433 n=1 Tax=Mytilus trossulus TaxID=6551 RepID=UPI003007917F
MHNNSRVCVMISLLAAFIFFLLSFNIRKVLSIVKTRQDYDLHLTIDSTSIVKGKGKYILRYPKGDKHDIISWSQYGQDHFIDKLFNATKHGFFVEIGGYDGESFSNTLFFEKIRGWEGLLIEASPFMYDIMLKKERGCYMVNACISKSLPSMTFLLAGAITSAEETLTDRHRKRIAREKITNRRLGHWAHTNDTVKVNCLPLLKIMRTLGRNHINYFSLDVEGAELHILNSIEWEKINIDVLTIETDQHRDQILSFMKQKGYEWIQQLRGDDIFKKKY